MKHTGEARKNLGEGTGVPGLGSSRVFGALPLASSFRYDKEPSQLFTVLSLSPN